MAKLDTLYHFNTGRWYGENKQPIDWMVVKNTERVEPFYFPYYVYFADRARGIAGIIPVMFGNIEDLLNNNWVLGQYDAYQYHDTSSVLERLKDAAPA